MTKLSLLIGGKLDDLAQGIKVETPEGTFLVSPSKIDGFFSFRIIRTETQNKVEGIIEKALAAGLTVIGASVNGASYLSLESFSLRLRDIVAEILSLALFDRESMLRALIISEADLARLYKMAKQVLECHISINHDQIVLEDINIREFRKFSEISRIGDITEILATLEPSDHIGIHLVRILRDGRFTISPEINHRDAFAQVLYWLRLV